VRGRSSRRIVGIALAAAGCAKGPGLFGETGTMAATMPDGERFDLLEAPGGMGGGGSGACQTSRGARITAQF
jgi:hypothetical protein